MIGLPRSPKRRVALAVGAAIALVVLIWGAILLQREFYRQQTRSLRQLMMAVKETRTNPKALDKRWPRLKERLAERIKEDPAGELAVLTYRTGAPIRAEVPRAARPGDPVEIILHYGDPLLADYLLPEVPFRWEAEVTAEWDSKVYPISKGTWGGMKTSQERIDLRAVLPEPAKFGEGTHVLKLKALTSLYLPASASATYSEVVDLGTYVMRIGNPKPTAYRRRS